MNKDEFKIGSNFWAGDKEWRCTDIGSRVIAAICLTDHMDDPSWLNGLHSPVLKAYSMSTTKKAVPSVTSSCELNYYKYICPAPNYDMNAIK